VDCVADAQDVVITANGDYTICGLNVKVALPVFEVKNTRSRRK
jgi:hypothetical protein